MAHVFNGYLVHSRWSGGTTLSGRSPSTSAQPFRTDLGLPVLAFETETDLTAGGYAARPPTGQPLVPGLGGGGDGPCRRLHLDSSGWPTAGGRARGLGHRRPRHTPRLIGCTAAPNSGPQHWVLDAAVSALNRWVRTGTPPSARRPYRDDVGSPPDHRARRARQCPGRDPDTRSSTSPSPPCRGRRRRGSPRPAACSAPPHPSSPPRHVALPDPRRLRGQVRRRHPAGGGRRFHPPADAAQLDEAAALDVPCRAATRSGGSRLDFRARTGRRGSTDRGPHRWTGPWPPPCTRPLSPCPARARSRRRRWVMRPLSSSSTADEGRQSSATRELSVATIVPRSAPPGDGGRSRRSGGRCGRPPQQSPEVGSQPVTGAAERFVQLQDVDVAAARESPTARRWSPWR